MHRTPSSGDLPPSYGGGYHHAGNGASNVGPSRTAPGVPPPILQQNAAMSPTHPQAYHHGNNHHGNQVVNPHHVTPNTHPLHHSHSTNNTTEQLREIHASLHPLQKPSTSGEPAHQYNGTPTSSASQLKSHWIHLEKIRQSLQPYQQAGGGYYSDQANSVQSPTTNGNTDPPEESQREWAMLNSLVSMGFEQDAAYCALKLTQFRGIAAAVDILVKTRNQIKVFRSNDRVPQRRQQVYENGVTGAGVGGSGGEGGFSRSESPLSASSSGYNRILTSMSGVSRSTVVPMSSVYSNRVPSPSSSGHVMSGGSAHHQSFANQQHPGGIPNQQQQQQQQQQQIRSHVRVHLQTPGLGNGAHVYSSPDLTSEYSIQQSSTPVVPPVRSTIVRKPLPQSAVTPTVVNVGSASLPGSVKVSPVLTANNLPPSHPQSQYQSPQHAPQNVQHFQTSHTPQNMQQNPPSPRRFPPLLQDLSPHEPITKPQQTKVLSAKFSSDSLSKVRINVSSEGESMNYQLEASAKSGEPIMSMQARAGGAPGDMGGGPTAAYSSSHIPQSYLQNEGHTAGIQSITVGDDLDPPFPPSKQYIEHLCRRVSTLLANQNPLGKRDSTASSASDSGPGLPIDSLSPLGGERGERSFAQMLNRGRSSPVSSLSTESSTEGPFPPPPPSIPTPPASPLPPSISRRLDSGSYEPIIKPCTAKAFRFFMEQHVENIVKQHKEREMRKMQLEREMMSADFKTPTQSQMRRLLAEKESRYLRQKRQRLTQKMFETIAKIGKGAFGKVTLVRKKDTKALYAMKILQKKDVIVRNQAAHVKAERDILSEADNEWVVKLYYSFQDRDSLFLIMEYIPGGDMMNLLIHKGIFEEELARFYIAELVCAIESVHRLGFIHRDIKPDNILIDRSGHIKLTDFGLCTGLRWTHDNKYYNDPVDDNLFEHLKQDSYDVILPKNNHKLLPYRHQRQRQTAHSLVGTPNYIAPEVLLRTGHTQLCDWWSVGVILYEMVIGRPPFCADAPAETQYKIVNWRKFLHIPREWGVEDETRNIILELCRDKDDRLGGGGATEVKQHAYFMGVNFAHLRESQALHVPTILSETDTSNFDPMEEQEETNESLAAAEQNSKQPGRARGEWGAGGKEQEGDTHAFYEFTFRRFFDSDPMGCPTIRRTPPRPSLHALPSFLPPPAPSRSRPPIPPSLEPATPGRDRSGVGDRGQRENGAAGLNNTVPSSSNNTPAGHISDRNSSTANTVQNTVPTPIPAHQSSISILRINTEDESRTDFVASPRQDRRNESGGGRMHTADTFSLGVNPVPNPQRKKSTESWERRERGPERGRRGTRGEGEGEGEGQGGSEKVLYV